jgi:hypothetical protein
MIWTFIRRYSYMTYMDFFHMTSYEKMPYSYIRLPLLLGDKIHPWGTTLPLGVKISPRGEEWASVSSVTGGDSTTRQRRLEVKEIIVQSTIQGCQIFRGAKYQNGENIPDYHKVYQLAIKCTCKLFQTDETCSNILHFSSLNNSTKLGLLVLNYTTWKPWPTRVWPCKD